MQVTVGLSALNDLDARTTQVAGLSMHAVNVSEFFVVISPVKSADRAKLDNFYRATLC